MKEILDINIYIIDMYTFDRTNKLKLETMVKLSNAKGSTDATYVISKIIKYDNGITKYKLINDKAPPSVIARAAITKLYTAPELSFEYLNAIDMAKSKGPFKIMCNDLNPLTNNTDNIIMK